MEANRLSSSMTYFYKVIFPAFWLGMFGLGTVALWVRSVSSPQDAAASAMRWPFTAALLAGFLLIRARLFGLKQVEVAPDGLIISNFRESDVVRWEDVVHVHESKLWNPRSITVVLRRPCRFGAQVTFLPKTKVFLLFGDHPTATLLRERAGMSS
jgi:hypothetical protein